MTTATATRPDTPIDARIIGVYPKQDEFCRSGQFVTGFVGGRGSGKSFVGSLKILQIARDGDVGMVVSPTYTMLEDSMMPTFRSLAEQYGLLVSERSSPKPRIVFRTQDGGIARANFRSAEKPERLRGPSLPWMLFDEASIIHHDAFKYGIAALRHKRRMGKCMLTFTPKGRRHWTFEVFFQEVKFEEIRRMDDVFEVGGRYYIPRADVHLVRSHTKESPFLASEYYDLIKGHYTSTLAAQELGGEFIDLEGLIFRAEWFANHFVSGAPRNAVRVRYWDRAATPGGGKYTAGVLMARDERNIYYIEDVVRGQWSAGERDNMIVQTAQKDAGRYNNEVLIFAEQEGGSAGKEISEQFIRRLAGFPVYRDIVSGKRRRIVDKIELPGEAKIVRAQPLAAQCEAGNVCIVQGAWNDEFLAELTGFPLYAFSDQVDGTSGAFNKLAKHGHMDPGEVKRPEVEAGGTQFGLTLVRSRQRRRGL